MPNPSEKVKAVEVLAVEEWRHAEGCIGPLDRGSSDSHCACGLNDLQAALRSEDGGVVITREGDLRPDRTEALMAELRQALTEWFASDADGHEPSDGVDCPVCYGRADDVMAFLADRLRPTGLSEEDRS